MNAALKLHLARIADKATPRRFAIDPVQITAMGALDPLNQQATYDPVEGLPIGGALFPGLSDEKVEELREEEKEERRRLDEFYRIEEAESYRGGGFGI